jgi:hypothetical protein
LSMDLERYQIYGYMRLVWIVLAILFCHCRAAAWRRPKQRDSGSNNRWHQSTITLQGAVCVGHPYTF